MSCLAEHPNAGVLVQAVKDGSAPVPYMYPQITEPDGPADPSGTTIFGLNLKSVVVGAWAADFVVMQNRLQENTLATENTRTYIGSRKGRVC